MANKYTAEITVQIDKKKCVLVYDWHALSELHSRFPDDLRGGLLDVGKVNDPLKLAAILAIGLKKHHPDVTEEFIIDLAPPLVPMKKPLDEALALAYFGADLMKGIIDAVDSTVKKPDKKTKGAKKKKK